MTGTESISQEPKLPPKEEFFDAVKRHICHILGFDYGFIDLSRQHDLLNVYTFSAADDDVEARQFVEQLQDEHEQPLTVANTHLAQKVTHTQSPWVGRAFSKNKDGADDPEGYPYVIVPMMENPVFGTGKHRGLIRVISFDTSREVTAQDVSTLKRLGEHLTSKLPQAVELLVDEEEEEGDAFAQKDVVLIAHSNRLSRRRYSRVLGNRYQLLEAESSDKAMEMLHQNRIDLVLLDADIQGTSGYAFCSVLKESEQWKQVPVILIAADMPSPDPNNSNSRIEGFRAGADDCLADTCADPELLARVKSALKHRRIEKELASQLQLLDDYAARLEEATEKLHKDKAEEQIKAANYQKAKSDSELLRNQDNLLHRISNTIRRSFNINENLRDMLEELAGWRELDCCFVVLPSEEEPQDSIRAEYTTEVDFSVIGTNGDLKCLDIFKKHFQVEQALVCNDAETDRKFTPFREQNLAAVPILSMFLIPVTYEQKLLGLLGGFRCERVAHWVPDNETFLKSVADQVASGVMNARLYARVQRQATTDGLTTLYNHRTGQEKLAEQLRVAERYQRNVAVVMIDVDHFKSINDNHGHPAGDAVLRSVASIIKNDCRDVDIPVRYGGEEFLLVLPEVNSEGAVVVAERIRRSLLAEVIQHDEIEIRVTASMGVASFPEDAQSQQSLLDLADKALYLSKRLGRNQVHTAQDLNHDNLVAIEQAEQAKLDSKPVEYKPTNFQAPPVPPGVEDKEELVPEVVEMVKALASTLYSKSEYNKVHHLETARLSELLAKVMGLSQGQVEQIRVAGLLHDVGTLSIPQELMQKDGVFTKEEKDIIKQHPVLGAQLLRPIRALRDVCEILEHHHERWDGTGYPNGMSGEEIPLAARIICIVESYHAMISDRPYRPAMSTERAIQALREGAGSQFDPFLVDIFIAVLNSLRENEKPERGPDKTLPHD
ncbi:MAG: diguanylate cyclase [Candidatus Melainabacteria bacterium]|nr:diguanylate cyclase [Candidatus Melainabacteria bacterium]